MVTFLPAPKNSSTYFLCKQDGVKNAALLLFYMHTKCRRPELSGRRHFVCN